MENAPLILAFIADLFAEKVCMDMPEAYLMSLSNIVVTVANWK